MRGPRPPSCAASGAATRRRPIGRPPPGWRFATGRWRGRAGMCPSASIARQARRRRRARFFTCMAAGFVLGDLESSDTTAWSLAERTGAVVASVDYRLQPEHPFPAAFEDCRAALHWLAENSGEAGIDPCASAALPLHGHRPGAGVLYRTRRGAGADHRRRGLVSRRLHAGRRRAGRRLRLARRGGGLCEPAARLRPCRRDRPDPRRGPGLRRRARPRGRRGELSRGQELYPRLRARASPARPGAPSSTRRASF